MFALDLAIFEGGVLDDYLDERGDLLPDDERALVERWRSVPVAPYEVTAVQPGVSVTMRPLLGGHLVRLADRSLSGSARRLDLFDGGYEPWEVAAFFGPQPPPVLHNREGHPLAQCTATYDIPEAEAEAAWSRLAAELEGDDDDDDGPDQLRATGELDDGERVIRSWRLSIWHTFRERRNGTWRGCSCWRRSRSTSGCWRAPGRMRASCTACRPTEVRKSAARCSTGRARWCSSRPPTCCRWRRPCCACCWGQAGGPPRRPACSR